MPVSASFEDRTRMATLCRGAALAVVVVLGAALAGPDARAQAAPEAGGEAPPVPVTIVELEPQDITLTAQMPGRVRASRVAEVRPQVNGLITERLFDEGTPVEQGDPLYKIDSDTYEADVALARAEVAQAKARMTVAEKAARRARELVGRQVASEQALDEAVSVRDATAAALDVAQARLHLAQIDLNRTTIRAPIAGVIGRSLTTVGALVSDGQAQPMAIIRTLDPVLVDVTQSAAEIIAWRRKQHAAELTESDPTVTLILADGESYSHTGVLTAAEPHADEQTGVVTLRMQFPNPDHLLLPGMYAEVEMPQGVAEDAILAPMEGVGRDRRGHPTALIVNADNVVEQRQLTIIGSRGSAWIVTEGLKGGDRLIVAGLQMVRPGVTVAPEPRGAAEARGSAEPAGAADADDRRRASAQP